MQPIIDSKYSGVVISSSGLESKRPDTAGTSQPFSALSTATVGTGLSVKPGSIVIEPKESGDKILTLRKKVEGGDRDALRELEVLSDSGDAEALNSLGVLFLDDKGPLIKKIGKNPSHYFKKQLQGVCQKHSLMKVYVIKMLKEQLKTLQKQ